MKKPRKPLSRDRRSTRSAEPVRGVVTDKVRKQALSIGSRSFHYFIAVADHGSFSRAAQSLRISQPALSRQIKRLEDHLETQLLLRHWRGIELTPSGQRLYDRATALQREFSNLSAEIAEEGRELRGSLVVAVTPTAGDFLLPDLVARYRKCNPHVEISIRQGYSDMVQHLLECGQADIAVFPTYGVDPSKSASLQMRPLLTELEFLVGHSGLDSKKTYSFREISRLPLVLPVRGNGLRTLVESIARTRDLTLSIAAEADGLTLIKALVSKGIGYTILPLVLVQKEIASGALQAARIGDPVIERTFMAAFHRKRGLSRAASHFLPLLVEDGRRAATSPRWPNARPVAAEDMP
jgi:LysR family nitrogen assimilation transcriptional regulator